MRDDQYVLNHATPYLARRIRDGRHNFAALLDGPLIAQPRDSVREAWRFPVVDTCWIPPDGSNSLDFNDVTFIYVDPDPASEVAVVGTFANLYEPIPLRRVNFLGKPTAYLALTLPLPRRSIFHYRFLSGTSFILDPINPQVVTLDNDAVWSRVFTWECTHPLELQRWQLAILERFCDHILPFRTREGERFMDWYYRHLSEDAKRGTIRGAFRIDDSAGAANYIDKILAREERHHLIDYQICLRQIDRLLRQREPAFEPENVSEDRYVTLYQQMADGNDGSVPGWDTTEYGSPRYFLNLLRRHAFTGAFAHPKYGGNTSNAGWAFLADRFPFDWQRSLEFGLGRDTTYRG